MPQTSNRFFRTNRFTRKSEFLNLKKSARKFSGRHWVAFYVVKTEGVSKLGLSASTRYGGAIVRNQFKRRIREWFRTNKRKIKTVDLHIVAKGRAPDGEKAAKMLYKQQFNDDLEKLSQFLSR